jgi:hypothetical protein
MGSWFWFMGSWFWFMGSWFGFMGSGFGFMVLARAIVAARRLQVRRFSGLQVDDVSRGGAAGSPRECCKFHVLSLRDQLTPQGAIEMADQLA